MSGTLAIPNSFGGQAGNVPAGQLDTNFTTISGYVNAREVMVGVIGARPAAGTAGRWYLATNVAGGTLYVDTGAAWVQTAPGVTQSASQASAKVRNSTNLSVPSGGSGTVLTFDTVIWDDGTFFNAGAPNRFTIATTGKYLLIGELDWQDSAASAGAAYEGFVLLNGITALADVVQYPGAPNASVRMVVSGLANLTAGDFVGLSAFQTTGAPLNVLANSPKSPSFSIMQIS